MKYDITSSQTKGAKRVLRCMSEALFDLLSQKSFTEISVNEVCEKAAYPRATFYNYFDDKYDLLNYLWYTIAKEIKVEEYTAVAPQERLPVFFDRLYDLFDDFSKQIKKIAEFNKADEYFMSSMRFYIFSQIRLMCENCADYHCIVPTEMLAEHYANTVYLVMDWKFLKKHECTKQQLYDLLTTLLNGI